MTKVYKILSAAEWAEAQTAGVFHGSAVDLKDGFIHLSSDEQAQATAFRHFKGVADLVLLTLDADELGPELRWDVSFGGALFPHLYGPMRSQWVEAVRPVPLAADGTPLLGALQP